MHQYIGKSTWQGIQRATLVAFLLSMTSWAEAQLSESEITQYVPPDTFLFYSLNMESVMEQVDTNTEMLVEFQSRETKTPFDFTRVKQYVGMFSSGVDEDVDQFYMPVVVAVRYDELFDQQAYVEFARQAMFERFVYAPEDYNGVTMYQAKLDDATRGQIGSQPGFFFPFEDMVATGGISIIRQMIDGVDDSTGKELVGNLDSQALFHLVLNDGSNVTAIPFFEFMEEGLAVPGFNPRETLESIRRLEVVLDFEQMVPLQITAEFRTESAAENVEKLIHTGLAAVPGLLEMAESELDSAIERGEDDVALIVDQLKAMMELANLACREVEISRSGDTIEVQLGNVDGLDALAQNAVTVIAKQQMLVEQFMNDSAQSIPDGMVIIDDQP